MDFLWHVSQIKSFLITERRAYCTATNEYLKELSMSTSNNLTYTDFATHSYAGNVVAAARQLVAALFAVKPRPAVAADEVVSTRQKATSAALLNSMANDWERHSPNLSAELRFLASRG
jgi:hypothetical protein